MSEELDAMLAAIVAAPDDDAPRLVYANHLMEREDPRGEWIALQCKLAREPATLELLDRDRELLALRGLPDGMVVRYERGFAVDATVWFEASDEAREFLSVEPLLQRLEVLACTGIEDLWWSVGELIEMAMPRLVQLELRDVDNTLECAEMFQRLPPRPATLVVLVVPEDVPLPAHWRS